MHEIRLFRPGLHSKFNQDKQCDFFFSSDLVKPVWTVVSQFKPGLYCLTGIGLGAS